MGGCKRPARTVPCPEAQVYDLLDGIRVLEVAVLAPDKLGVHLADLGAEVIKIEMPPHGDHVRLLGPPFRGGPALSHLRWNRGKKSVSLNLKTPQGRDVFLDLARNSQVVVDGLRSGAMDSFGLGYDAVQAANPSIVYCSINGMGQTGPYRRLGTHGFGYDGFAGIAPIEHHENGAPYIGRHIGVGSVAGPLFGALAIAAALVKTARTGQGQQIDVAEVDSAVHWRADELSTGLNLGVWRERSMPDSVRYQYYEAKDGKYIMFQAFEWKFWETFCRVVERPDLLNAGGSSDLRNALDNAAGNESLRQELAAIMKTRTQAEWVDFFIKHNIPGCPAYSLQEMLEDPHFKARENVMTAEHPDAGTYQTPTSPIKLPGQAFDVLPAPRVGQHNQEFLVDLLGYDAGRISELTKSGAIGGEA